MAYFAMVVPNTALAKSAGSSGWSQGFDYVWNFVAPYALWIPLLLVAALAASRLARWWPEDRIGVVVFLTPAIGGLLDVAYVVHVGGDYMHARLLLPGFFALLLVPFMDDRQLKVTSVVLLSGLMVWCIVTAGWLRFTESSAGSVVPVTNERNYWVGVTNHRNPIRLSDFRNSLNNIAGSFAGDYARSLRGHDQRLVFSFYPPLSARVHSNVPFSVAYSTEAIGLVGVIAGPKVYVFDADSLANPIGSHFVGAVANRQGKIVGNSVGGRSVRDPRGSGARGHLAHAGRSRATSRVVHAAQLVSHGHHGSLELVVGARQRRARHRVHEDVVLR